MSGKEEDEIEAKLIASKDMGPWNVTANPLVEIERETKPTGEKEWESKPGLAVGAAYQTGGRVTPGLELLLLEDESRITPGLYIDIVPGVRLNLGVGFGLEKAADDARFKSLLELEF